MNQGIPVEEAQALIKRGLERDSGLASFLVTSFVDQAIESGKSEERSDDDSNVGSTCTKSATESVVTFRTAWDPAMLHRWGLYARKHHAELTLWIELDGFDMVPHSQGSNLQI
jgi:hypothetical protein